MLILTSGYQFLNDTSCFVKLVIVTLCVTIFYSKSFDVCLIIFLTKSFIQGGSQSLNVTSLLGTKLEKMFIIVWLKIVTFAYDSCYLIEAPHLLIQFNF